MIRKSDILDGIGIAAPCPASWEKMEGDDRVRHCDECRLNVYNVAELERDDAIRLIQSAEGRLCLRLHRRWDGTVITRDCPRGVAAARRKAAVAFACACGLLLSVASFAMGVRGKGSAWGYPRLGDPSWRNSLPSAIRVVVDWIDPRPSPAVGMVVMGGPPPVAGKMMMPVQPKQTSHTGSKTAKP
jgi:hypothetical protein